MRLAPPLISCAIVEQMDFGEFERLVLRMLFETNLPLTAVHVAYVAGIPVKMAERHLARMVEHGTLWVRASTEGEIEYYFPNRRGLAAAAGGVDGDGVGTPIEALRRDANNPLTAVLLSMLIPGAGHIYAGRSGAGVAWMASTLAGYACCFLPGLFLHGLCLVSAAHARQN